MEEKVVQACFIVGGGEVIRVQKRSVREGVFELIGAYYIFNVEYPQVYTSALSVIQEIALEEPVTGRKTKKYKQFVTKLRAEFVKVTEEETQNVGTP